MYMVKRALEMLFRRLFAIIYWISSRSKARDPFNSGDGERMCRYLTDRGEFRGSIVRYSAFMPPTKSPRKSVYWTSGIADEEIWRIGDTYVAPARGPILGRADFNSLTAYEAGLAIDLTKIPHPRHADIVRWDPDRKKSRLQAIKLADAASFVAAP